MRLPLPPDRSDLHLKWTQIYKLITAPAELENSSVNRKSIKGTSPDKALGLFPSLRSLSLTVGTRRAQGGGQRDHRDEGEGASGWTDAVANVLAGRVYMAAPIHLARTAVPFRAPGTHP